MSLLNAKPFTHKEMKLIIGGAIAGREYFCTLDVFTSCTVYPSLTACVQSGCPSNKCKTFSICID